MNEEQQPKPLSEAERRLQEATTIATKREVRWLDGRQSLHRIVQSLDEEIKRNAPESEPFFGSHSSPLIDLVKGAYKAIRPSILTRSINGAQLSIDPMEKSAIQPRDVLGDREAFRRVEVFAYSSIKLSIHRASQAKRGLSHSLWYCDASKPGDFRWHQVGFKLDTPGPISDGLFGYAPNYMPWDAAGGEPFALPPEGEAYCALEEKRGWFDFRSPRPYSVAYRLAPIDRDQERSFMDQWLLWFANAAHGELP